MPSPKAILRDIADRKLDPKTDYTKAHIDASGRVKAKGPVVETAPEKAPAAEEKHEPKKAEVSEKKSTTKAESPSTAKKPATAPSHSKGKVPAVVASVTAPEGTSSVENNVEANEPKAAEVSTEVGNSDDA